MMREVCVTITLDNNTAINPMTVKAINLGTQSFRKALINQMEIMKATVIPTSGANTIKLTVLITGSGFTLFMPAWAIAAPAKPPINVCEDEEGMPNHQVSRFQLMAAISP